MTKYPARLAALAAALALSGCATGDVADYPSLAQRPVERQANVPPAPTAVVAVPEPVSATLAEAIRALAGDADRGEAAFQSALGEARTVAGAGRGAAVGSEAWAQAQMSVSRLEAARGPTTLALAELDRLVVQQGDGGNGVVPEALTAEQARVAALVAAQDAVVAGLSGD